MASAAAQAVDITCVMQQIGYQCACRCTTLYSLQWGKRSALWADVVLWQDLMSQLRPVDKAIMLQVESVQLSCESAHKQLELELANAKHNAAQAAAAHKSAAASWQGELDWHKSEVP